MLSNGNHSSPGLFSLPPTFWSLFTATVGVKMLSSPHWSLTKRKPTELYNTVKLLEQQKKEHYLLKLIIFDHCPFLQKHGRGLEKRKGREGKQTNSESLFMCVVYMRVHVHTHTRSVGTALRCLSGFQYSLRLSKIFDITGESPVPFKLDQSESRQWNQISLPGKSQLQV